MKLPISINRNKLTHFMLIALSLLALFSYLKDVPKYISGEFILSIPLAIVLGLFSIFMIIFLVRSIKVVFDSSPALIINQDGIIDNVSYAKAGLITWNEIESVSVKKFNRREHLVLEVIDPQKFIETASGIKRSMLEQSMNKCASPISINSRELNIDITSLKVTIESLLNKSAFQTL